MQPADVPEVAALERQLFAGDSPWTEAMFLGELRAGNPYWVLRGEGASSGAVPGDIASDELSTAAPASPRGARLVICGYAGLAVSLDDADVQTIGLAPAVRGRGYGRALLRTLLDAAGDRVVHLEVRTDNAVAIALYESEGFERIGIRRHYYHPSRADAFTMIRPRR